LPARRGAVSERAASAGDGTRQPLPALLAFPHLEYRNAPPAAGPVITVPHASGRLTLVPVEAGFVPSGDALEEQPGMPDQVITPQLLKIQRLPFPGLGQELA
jgi:hypothetical protein